MPFTIRTSLAVPDQTTVRSDARGLPVSSNPQTANPSFPILLSDQVTVQSGGEQDFRSEAFTNNLGRPIELRGMRILIELQPVSGAAAPPTGVRGGGIIALEIEVDGVKVTRGAVPVWHLGRSDNRRNDTYTLNAITNYSWYFSQPIPVMPGRGVRVQTKHLGGVTPQAGVSVAFAGRVSPNAIPRRIPYVAAWSSRAFQYAEVGVDTSPPAALVNDTDRELVVDRIIGRSVAYDDSTGAVEELADYDDLSLQGVTSMAVRLGLSQGRPILKTYTMWRAVFGQNAALETDFIMKPLDYLTADVAHAAGPALAVPFAYSQNRGSLSIVGWREV